MKFAIRQLTQQIRDNPRSAERPPSFAGIEWIAKGVGWDCREVYYEGKKRHRRYLGHIGRETWEGMRSRYSPSELKAHVEQWISGRLKKKTIER